MATRTSPLIGLLALFFYIHAIHLAEARVANTSKNGPKTSFSLSDAQYLYPGQEVVLTVDWLTQPEERVMALTFDDGPDEKDLEIASILKKNNVSGAFFYIGNKVQAKADIVQEIMKADLEIGYHSYQHQKLTSFSQPSLTSDFRHGKTNLSRMGIPVTWFRPPYGEFNQQVVNAAKGQGMETILWTIDSRDWTGISASSMARNVIRQFHPGAVLLFHSTHAATLQALPEVIAAAKKEGYRLVSLKEWRQTILTANCRMSASLCPPGQTVASADSTPKTTYSDAAKAAPGSMPPPIEETPATDFSMEESAMESATTPANFTAIDNPITEADFHPIPVETLPLESDESESTLPVETLAMETTTRPAQLPVVDAHPETHNKKPSKPAFDHTAQIPSQTSAPKSQSVQSDKKPVATQAKRPADEVAINSTESNPMAGNEPDWSTTPPESVDAPEAAIAMDAPLESPYAPTEESESATEAETRPSPAEDDNLAEEETRPTPAEDDNLANANTPTLRSVQEKDSFVLVLTRISVLEKDPGKMPTSAHVAPASPDVKPSTPAMERVAHPSSVPHSAAATRAEEQVVPVLSRVTVLKVPSTTNTQRLTP